MHPHQVLIQRHHDPACVFRVSTVSHRWRHVGEDGRLDEVPLRIDAARRPPAPAHQECALVSPDLDVLHHRLELCLADRRPKSKDMPEIDVLTAVDVAIRDLVEIESIWGTPQALERLSECRAMLADDEPCDQHAKAENAGQRYLHHFASPRRIFPRAGG